MPVDAQLEQEIGGNAGALSALHAGAHVVVATRLGHRTLAECTRPSLTAHTGLECHAPRQTLVELGEQRYPATGRVLAEVRASSGTHSAREAHATPLAMTVGAAITGPVEAHRVAMGVRHRMHDARFAGIAHASLLRHALTDLCVV